MCPEKEMRGVYTPTNIAPMTYLQSLWDRTKVEFPDEYMREPVDPI
jgi:hypothetical protein